MTYLEFREWVVENKNKAAIIAGFVVVFLVGYGVGSYEKTRRNKPSLLNKYNTNQSLKAKTSEQQETTADNKVLGTASSSTESLITSGTECVVKGNISSSGGKIYHVQGGAFYKTVKPEQCFKTETEAVTAGFRKSGR